MKWLFLVCALAVALGAAVMSCGPQKPYCADAGGPCIAPIDGIGGSGGDMDAGGGEATIITGP
jgi:hypothetical protein